MHKTNILAHFVVLLLGALALVAAMPASAVTALSVALDAGANCTSSADLQIAWSGAGMHEEFGMSTDRLGSVIGTFGPAASSNSDFSGTYQVPITTAQPDNAVIGSYAWIGSNPPSASTAVEFFVLYNCSTRAVLQRCLGPYGTCPRTAAAGLAALATSVIPTSSREMLAVMIVLIMALAGAILFRRRPAVRPRRGS